ncbi:MAG: phosphoribosylanthranilate isomerase [Candidatus Omnitrophota bacterium]|nr:MAG: phosphoribosylanthranilate isomerase [Candidatus Omnitrophota bacterium]
MVKVKICGITESKDALKAHELGADFVGFIFFTNSPRKVKPEEARLIIEGLPKDLLKVGLFLGQDAGTVRAIAERCRLDFLQLHGDESPEYCRRLGKDFNIIKSFKIKNFCNVSDINAYEDAAHYYLFDTYVEGMPGGTGKTFNWDILKYRPFEKPIFLAGGLTPKNVEEAIRKAAPYAVDVASGVEKSPGKKDYGLLKEFIDNAKKA